jgi:hypothetical protein
MKYAAQIVSNAMTCIPSFIKIGPGIHKLTEWIHSVEIS